MVEQEKKVVGWAADIPAMLAAGDHLQGQAEAGVVSSGKVRAGNEILKKESTTSVITVMANALN